MISLGVVLFTFSFCRVFAQTSLYIPDFDPQPVSVSVIGVDSQGRTTYQLQPGVVTNSDEGQGFDGTGML
ncbi:hypothetical protein FISHEDRAFT_70164 [Fistulina hepatica ATCC 64428]|uniref:Uncharacterized protein n=1 Tax=Fistulina hepatica ATCC 64428 TaxID=1128425 RepID=A0A0D7AK60_9AGAR|nr:hypothetical protein FISHEDRAFT_70164 [Fistulina hepatica ATCC 64428]